MYTARSPAKTGRFLSATSRLSRLTAFIAELHRLRAMTDVRKERTLLPSRQCLA
jgi:hypothetical protein